MKYKEWLTIWLENYVKPTVKHRTYMRYESIVSNHIIQRLGDYEINELSLLVIQTCITEMINAGNIKTGGALSANTGNSIITIIQKSLKTAYENNLTTAYMADKIKRPKSDETSVECFTLAEQKKIEKAVLEDKRPKMFGIIFCLYTGLRIGELLALKWSDIDFKKGEISVTKTCYDDTVNGHFCRMIDTPKTKKSKRQIPIPKQLIPMLKEIKNKNGSEWVVGDKEKTIFIRSYQSSFALLLKKLNIPHHGFHSLRHTFATRALESGMDVKTLSDLLGHKNSTVTLNRYAHSLLSHKHEMMNKLGKMINF